MKTQHRVTLAAMIAAVSVLPTVAMAAQATASVNVRSGPSTGYGVVDTLYPGEVVEVDRCAGNGWCYVSKSGPDGWVSSRYLSDSKTRAVSKPTITLSFSFGPGNGFSYGQPRGSDRDLVCLVTFFNKSQVTAGADANVQRARLLPLHEATRRDAPNDRHRIFDYGTNRETRDTCRYLNAINN